MNIFVTVTPFQQYVVDRIIKQYYPYSDNIVITTLRKAKNIINSSIINGRDIISILKVKNLIRKNIEKCVFFIPHIGTFYSAWLYSLSIQFNRPINIYYEGIALLYDSKNNVNQNKYIRQITGKILGFNYVAFEELYPYDLCKRIEKCYTPVLLEKYHNKCALIQLGDELPKTELLTQTKNVLILTSNNYSDQFIYELKSILKSLSDSDNIYLKFHYALSDKDEQRILKIIKSNWNGFLNILEKNVPLESYLNLIRFRSIYSQDFSSALINLYFINYEDIHINVINKSSINTDIVKLVGMSIE